MQLSFCNLLLCNSKFYPSSNHIVKVHVLWVVSINTLNLSYSRAWNNSCVQHNESKNGSKKFNLYFRSAYMCANLFHLLLRTTELQHFAVTHSCAMTQLLQSKALNLATNHDKFRMMPLTEHENVSESTLKMMYVSLKYKHSNIKIETPCSLLLIIKIGQLSVFI